MTWFEVLERLLVEGGWGRETYFSAGETADGNDHDEVGR